jgi:hypothetical protein
MQLSCAYLVLGSEGIGVMGKCKKTNTISHMDDFYVPEINKKFFCVLNQEDTALSAIISSYIYNDREYTPMFEFSEVLVSKYEENIDEKNEEYFSKTYAETFNIQVSNALLCLGNVECLILGNLSYNQKSYFTFLDGYNVIEINSFADVDRFLKEMVDQSNYLYCNPKDFHVGLYTAINNKLLLKLQAGLPRLPIELYHKKGIVLIEDIDSVSTVIAINYAISIDFDIYIIRKPDLDKIQIRDLIENWQNSKNGRYFLELSSYLYNSIEDIDFTKYMVATFFTFGAPYSLVLKNIIPINYVNNILSPDFFIFNNVYQYKKEPIFSSIVFSPLEFGSDEETTFVINKLKENLYYVRELIGKEASVFNIDTNIQEFPFEILHICSHGGEVNGFSLCEEFTDRDGISHIVEFDEIVSFAPTHGEELIQVTSKYIWRKFDGLVWKSKELNEKSYPHYVFNDMLSEIYKKEKKKRTKKEIIVGSCGIKCSDFNYQAVFNSIAGSHSNPHIFNNTCWSFYEIPESFLSVGANSYIGTLWAINNTNARNVAESFYDNLFDGSILMAYQKAIELTKNTNDEDIYVFWGLHFSKIEKGKSINSTRIHITDKLLTSQARWRRQLKKVEDESVKYSIERLIKWDLEQLNNYFPIEKDRLIISRLLLNE